MIAEMEVNSVGVIHRMVVPIARLEPKAPERIALNASAGLFPLSGNQQRANQQNHQGGKNISEYVNAKSEKFALRNFFIFFPPSIYNPTVFSFRFSSLFRLPTISRYT